jgi:hypothetical protein
VNILWFNKKNIIPSNLLVCEDTASKIDKYLDFMEEIENRADMGEQTKKQICGISADALRPLIDEQDTEIRDIAIQKISEDVKGKQHAGRGHRK